MYVREHGALVVFLLLAGSSASAIPVASAAQTVDSLIFRRLPGYWEDQPLSGARSERLAGYRLTISPAGELHFMVEHGADTGQEERQETSAEAVAPLFTLADSVDLDGVPEKLMGEPWCGVVATDAPSVAIGLARGDEVAWVVDDHGCLVGRDESDDGLLERLRELERTASRIVDFGQRFDALPLLDP